MNWRAERQVMCDREVAVPRLIGGFRLDEGALDARRDPRRRHAFGPGRAVQHVGLNLCVTAATAYSAAII